jgi:hypothetical protein
MANETTTTTLDDATHATLVQPFFKRALSEKPGLWRFARQTNLIGQAAQGAKIVTETSWWGSPADDGAGVDTEFDATAVTDIANTAVSTGSVSITPAEYGIAQEVEDKVGEDSVSGWETLVGAQRMLHVMQLAWEDDFCALFAGASNSSGTSGSDMTLADMLSAQTGCVTRGVDAPDGGVYVLDVQQMADFNSAGIATNAAAAVFALSADRILNVQPAAGHGLSNRMIAGFRGFPVWVTGLTDTANAAADVVGAFLIHSTAANDENCFAGMAIKRLPRFETERHAKKRTTDLVMTSRVGFGEELDGAATKIVTDA